jgi:hypothetical protein
MSYFIFYFRVMGVFLSFILIINFTNAQVEACKDVVVSCKGYKKIVQKLPTLEKGQKNLDTLIRQLLMPIPNIGFDPEITFDLNEQGKVGNIKGEVPMLSRYFFTEMIIKKIIENAGNWTPLLLNNGKSVKCTVVFYFYIDKDAIRYHLICLYTHLDAHCENQEIYKGAVPFK